MVWIDNKKAFDMVPQSWIKKLSQNVQNITWSHKLDRENHENLESGIDSRKKKLRRGRRRRGIFPEDALSLLQFIIPRMQLTHILRKYTAEYKLSGSQEKINHLIYMDDIKLFAKN